MSFFGERRVMVAEEPDGSVSIEAWHYSRAQRMALLALGGVSFAFAAVIGIALAASVHGRGHDARIYLDIGGFAGFMAVFPLVALTVRARSRTRLSATPQGLSYRSLFLTTRVAWHEIARVDVVAALLRRRTWIPHVRLRSGATRTLGAFHDEDAAHELVRIVHGLGNRWAR